MNKFKQVSYDGHQMSLAGGGAGERSHAWRGCPMSEVRLGWEESHVRGWGTELEWGGRFL